ncbi:TRAP transporter large permease [Alcaligenaceae bacterium]|nr:TRAP transporter large permease [Alcaligenaceae bacterium]
MTILGIAIFFILMLIGAPIWSAMLMGGATIALFDVGQPLQTVSSQFFISADSWLLLAVPYFLFAGNLMTNFGLANRLFGFVENLIGHMRGGLPATGVITCAIFGALSGSSVATVVAVGSMLIPYMLKAGYKESEALGVIAVSGTLGQMIPPSIYMILFASIVQMDVSKLFLAGFVPGILITILLVMTAVILSKNKKQGLRKQATGKEVWSSFIESLPAFMMPVLVLGGIYAGVFTPTEAAAVAVVYVLLMGFIYERKNFNFKNFKNSALDALVTTTVIYIILGGATVLSNALTFANVPQAFTQFMISLPVSNEVTMGLILLVFLILGTVLDPVPILYIAVPIIFPVVQALGFSVTHFAILTITCMMVAQVTPPVGMSLFALSGFFRVPIGEVVKGSLPYLVALLIALGVLWFVPQLSTFSE